jgi:hypothetical protein
MKLATMHDSDFVQQNAANTKTNKCHYPYSAQPLDEYRTL